jgi:hypothetical protein
MSWKMENISIQSTDVSPPSSIALPGSLIYIRPITTPNQIKDLTETLNITSVQSFLSPDEPFGPKLEKSQVGARVPVEFELGRIVPGGRVVESPPLVVGPTLAAGDGVLQDAIGKQL